MDSSANGELMRRSFLPVAGSISVIPKLLIENRPSCAFRPGYGKSSSGKVATTRPLGMSRIVRPGGSDANDFSSSPSLVMTTAAMSHRGEQRSAGDEQRPAQPSACRAGARRSAGGLGEIERRIVLEDRALELPQRRAGLQAELGSQPRRGTAVRVERLRLPAAAVEREHQLAEQVLAVGMGRDERLELADYLPVAAERELGLDPRLGRREHQLIELRHLGPAHDSSRRSASGLAPHELDARYAAAAAPRPEAPPRRPADELLEPLDVEFPALEVKHIAALDGRDSLRSDRLSERGDMELNDLVRGLRAATVPDLLDQPLARDRAPAREQQQREQRARLRSAERDLSAAVEDLERPKDPEFHFPPVSLGTTVHPRDKRVYTSAWAKSTRGFTALRDPVRMPHLVTSPPRWSPRRPRSSRLPSRHPRGQSSFTATAEAFTGVIAPSARPPASGPGWR